MLKSKFSGSRLAEGVERCPDPEISGALFTGLEIHRILQTPRNLHFKVRNRCACHEVCAYRQRFTQSALRGSRSAAPAMKPAVPVHKALRLPRALQLKVLKVLRAIKAPLLPRNLLLEVLEVLCLPRNLHFQCTKCRSCHETCYWRCSKCCARDEICSSSAQTAALATKFATGGAKSAARATKSTRRFAVAGAALCERYFVFDTN